MLESGFFNPISIALFSIASMLPICYCCKRKCTHKKKDKYTQSEEDIENGLYKSHRQTISAFYARPCSNSMISINPIETIDMNKEAQSVKSQFDMYKKSFVPRRPRKVRGNSIPSLDEESQKITQSSNK